MNIFDFYFSYSLWLNIIGGFVIFLYCVLQFLPVIVSLSFLILNKNLAFKKLIIPISLLFCGVFVFNQIDFWLTRRSKKVNIIDISSFECVSLGKLYDDYSLNKIVNTKNGKKSFDEYISNYSENSEYKISFSCGKFMEKSYYKTPYVLTDTNEKYYFTNNIYKFNILGKEGLALVENYLDKSPLSCEINYYGGDRKYIYFYSCEI
jgi:hypothetical protein